MVAVYDANVLRQSIVEALQVHLMCLSHGQLYVACGGATAAVAAVSYSPAHALTHILAAAANARPAASLREAGAVAVATRALSQRDPGSRKVLVAASSPACSQPSGTAAADVLAGCRRVRPGLDAAQGCGAGFLGDQGAVQAACLALAALCAGSPGARAEFCREGVRVSLKHEN